MLNDVQIPGIDYWLGLQHIPDATAPDIGAGTGIKAAATASTFLWRCHDLFHPVAVDEDVFMESYSVTSGSLTATVDMTASVTALREEFPDADYFRATVSGTLSGHYGRHGEAILYDAPDGGGVRALSDPPIDTADIDDIGPLWPASDPRVINPPVANIGPITVSAGGTVRQFRTYLDEDGNPMYDADGHLVFRVTTTLVGELMRPEALRWPGQDPTAEIANPAVLSFDDVGPYLFDLPYEAGKALLSFTSFTLYPLKISDPSAPVPPLPGEGSVTAAATPGSIIRLPGRKRLR